MFSHERRALWALLVSAVACGGGETGAPVSDAGVDAAARDASAPDAQSPRDLSVEVDAVVDLSIPDAGVPDAFTCDCPAPTDCAAYACDDSGACVQAPAPRGTDCTLSETADGICLAGECVLRGCGDSFREVGPGPAAEACDDGNGLDGDLCGTDCMPTVLEVERLGEDESVDLGSHRRHPVVGVAGDGTALVAWRREDGDGSNPMLLGRRFDRFGGPLGGTFVIHTERVVSPHVIGLREGGFVVGFNSFGSKVHYRVVSASGAVGGVRNAPADPLTPVNAVALAPLADGFVMAWVDGRDRFGVDAAGGVYFRRFSATGSPLDPGDRRAAADARLREGDPWVASDGEVFMVAWTQSNLDFTTTVQARRFQGTSTLDSADVDLSPAGRALGQPLAVGLTYPSSPPSSGEGRFFVIWHEFTPERGTFGRRFDIGSGPGPVTLLAASHPHAVVAPLPGSTASETDVVAIYLEGGGSADIVATSPLPMAVETLRADLTYAESGVGVVAAPDGLWFSFLAGLPNDPDRLGIFFLPLPELPLAPAAP